MKIQTRKIGEVLFRGGFLVTLLAFLYLMAALSAGWSTKPVMLASLLGIIIMGIGKGITDTLDIKHRIDTVSMRAENIALKAFQEKLIEALKLKNARIEQLEAQVDELIKKIPS